MNKPINIFFDGPPGPEGGRFIEVETDDFKSIEIGEWIEHRDGNWALRITELPVESQTKEERQLDDDRQLDLEIDAGLHQ